MSLSRKNPVTDKLDTDQLLKELFQDYTLEEFGLKDLNVSARVLQNWSESGLLPKKKREPDENHKFNFVELIWLKIVVELRNLGFPLYKIKIAKETLLVEQSIGNLLGITEKDNVGECLYLFWRNTKVSKKALENAYSSPDVTSRTLKKKFSPLQLFVQGFISDRRNFKVIVFDRGDAIIYHPDFYVGEKTLEKFFESETHITIPFMKIFKEFLEDDRYYNFISRTKILNDNELQILSLIREKKAETITIHFKNGDPKFIEVKRNTNILKEARISEILLNRGYEEFVIKTNGGKISFSSITTKHHLK